MRTYITLQFAALFRESVKTQKKELKSTLSNLNQPQETCFIVILGGLQSSDALANQKNKGS